MAFGIDALYLIPILFLLTAALFTLTYAGQQLIPALESVPGFNVINPALASISGVISPLQATNSILANYPKFDNLLPFVFFMVMIAILAGAALTPTNPIVIPVTFFVMLVVLLLTFLTSNAAHTFLGATIFQSVAGIFPNIEGLWANLGPIEFVFFLLLMGVEAMRSRSSGGGNQGGMSASHNQMATIT